jgi:hypothetical protein
MHEADHRAVGWRMGGVSRARRPGRREYVAAIAPRHCDTLVKSAHQLQALKTLPSGRNSLPDPDLWRQKIAGQRHIGDEIEIDDWESYVAE